MDFGEIDRAPLYRRPAARWGPSDFEEVQNLYDKAAEDYSKQGVRCLRARTYLLSFHNLHDLRVELEKTGGGLVDDRHYMQLAYLQRGVQALKSLYCLVRNHCYTACYGRLRFLLELYLVVRDLNRDKEQTAKKWQRAVKDLKENDYDRHDEIYLTKFFKGKRKQLRGEFTSKHKMYDKIYGRMSGAGVHPDSIKSSGLEDGLDEILEEDVITFGLIFIYAMAAQYRRTFEDSPLEKFVNRITDAIMMQSWTPLDDTPLFLEEDLDYLPLEAPRKSEPFEPIGD